MRQTESVKWTADSGTTYDIEVSFDVGVDDDYGSDADGNRGVRIEFMENVKIDGPDDMPEEDRWQMEACAESIMDKAWEQSASR